MIQITLQEPTDLADGDAPLDGTQEAFGRDGVYAMASLAAGERSNSLLYQAAAGFGSALVARFRVDADVRSNGPIVVHLAVTADGAIEYETTVAHAGGDGAVTATFDAGATFDGAVLGAQIHIANNGDLEVGVDDVRLYWEGVGAATNRPSAPVMQQLRRSRR